MANILTRLFGNANERMLKRLRPVIDEINELEAELQELPAEAFPERTAALKERLASEDEEVTLDDVLPEAFALVREASRRTIGLRHYDVQLIGGIVLHRGMIAEMKTGEGKTLVATLPLYLNALSGKGAHLVTVNDYLARRDVQWMGPIYSYLGLSVGTIIHDASFLFDPTYIPKDYRFLHLRPVDRGSAYLADVTYGTNNEFGFDYLRDNMKFTLEEYAQRELNYAIVDEVDNILIDEARTPLIISGPAEASSELYRTVDRIIPRLTKEVDFTIDEKHRNVTLTEDGVQKCERLLGVGNLYDPSQIALLHHVQQALKAHTLFKRDVDYVVKDGHVVIVDEFTGRLMEGRRWSDGLHQAVEAKEKVKIEDENQTLATITIQNYFRMYAKLAGMTGTADTEAVEFQNTYKLEVAVIPPNKTNQRDDQPDVVYKSAREKFDAVVDEIKASHEKGQPVLVGTTSVEKSELVSRLLKKAGVRHNVLNAINHELEANIIAQAGRLGAVTIATNMAGRGTDILLGGNPEFLARAEMENEHVRGLLGDTGSADGERLEDAVRSLHERYMETKEQLRQRYEPLLQPLDAKRAETYTAEREADAALRELSPWQELFARYGRMRDIEFDPSLRHEQSLPQRYLDAKRELQEALLGAHVPAADAEAERVRRLGQQFDALVAGWQALRAGGEAAKASRRAPAGLGFLRLLADAVLRPLPVDQQRTLLRHVVQRDPKLAADAAEIDHALVHGHATLADADAGIRDACTHLVVDAMPPEHFAELAQIAVREAADVASEGLHAWRNAWEEAMDVLERALLLAGAVEADGLAERAAAYRAAHDAHVEAERAFEEQRRPYEEAVHTVEQENDAQQAEYKRRIEEVRESMQKAPAAYDSRYKELLEKYQELCLAERENVQGAGGLHIIGTERHEARRIDNQLRGRAGRQGDPGSSRFFLSLEDDLLRIFGADRMQNLMQRLGMEEGVPIEHRFVTRAIRNAQEKVEAHNFDIRKHLLEYDDVLNKQREVIYARRREILTKADLSEDVLEMADGLAEDLVAQHCPETVAVDEWDVQALDDAIFGQFNLRLHLVDAAQEMERSAQMAGLVAERVKQAYAERERAFGAPVLRHLERLVWLQTLDSLWRDHLLSMDHLKEGIGLRGYGQQNPLQAYQKEGYELFEDLVRRMESDVVEKLMTVQVQTQPAAARPVAAVGGGAPQAVATGPVEAAVMPREVQALERQAQRQTQRMQLRHGDQPAQQSRPETVRREAEKVGRNEPCPCGSGKKYKKCHGAQA